MNSEVLDIDIAKNTFQLHGVGGPGKADLKKRLSRSQVAAYVANVPASSTQPLFFPGNIPLSSSITPSQIIRTPAKWECNYPDRERSVGVQKFESA